MSDPTPAFPPLHVYVLAHRCTTCGAEPGEPCDAPRKEAAVDSLMEQRARFGQPQLAWDSQRLMHARRQDAGRWHFERDEMNAPWPAGRVPGRRYDTLG